MTKTNRKETVDLFQPSLHGAEQMRFDKLPVFLVRKNNIPIRFIQKFSSPGLHRKIQIHQESQNKLKGYIDHFIKNIEVVIKEVHDNQERKKLINLKRDIYNLRPRFVNNIQKNKEILLQTSLFEQADAIQQEYQLCHSLLEEIREYFEDKKQVERSALYEAFSKESTLMNTLKFIQPTIMEKARSYFDLPVEKHGVKQRKLDYTLLKLLTRATLKTSPFSTLTKVGLGEFSDRLPMSKEISEGRQYTVTNLNITYMLRLFEKVLLRPSVIKKLSFRFNETLTVLENHFYWTTLADYPQKRKKIYRTADTLIKIKYNPLMGSIHERLKDEELVSYEELESVFADLGINKHQALQYITKLASNDFLQPARMLKEQSNHVLADFLKQIDELEVKGEDETVFKVYQALSQIKNELEAFDQLDVKQSYISYQKINQLFKDVSAELQMPLLDEKLLIYQDFLSEEKQYINQEDWTERDQQLVTFQHLTVLFDAVLRLQYILGRSVFEKYGDMRVSLKSNEQEDVIEELLNAILEHAGEIWGSQFTETALNSDIEEINELDRAKNNFIQYLKRQAIEEDQEGIIITNRFVQELIESISADLSNYVQSNSFFIQEEGPKGQMVINNMYGGYLSYFLRFFYNMEGILDFPQVSQYIKKNVHSRNIIDIYKSYGFNANVRPKITEYSIDVPNSRVSDVEGFTGIFSWKDLEIQYNQKTKKADIFAKGQQVNILFLGSLMTRLIPSISAMLHAFSANGVLFRDVGSILLDDFLLNTDGSFTVKVFPRITLEESTVLSRKSWLVNTNAIANHSDDDMENYLNFIKFIDYYQIPHRVFLRKKIGQADESGENEENADGAFEKPQYIDFTSPLLWNLFKKEIEGSPYFLLTEVFPDFKDKENEFVEEYLVEYTSKGVN